MVLLCALSTTASPFYRPCSHAQIGLAQGDGEIFKVEAIEFVTFVQIQFLALVSWKCIEFVYVQLRRKDDSDVLRRTEGSFE